MSRDLNRFAFIGRLGGDPEMRYTPNGKAVTRFSIAVGDDYKNSNGQKVERTNWFDISIFGPSAEAANNLLVKGTLVYVEGKITKSKSGEGQDAKWYTNFEASNFQLLKGGSDYSAPRDEDEGETEEYDDIPF